MKPAAPIPSPTRERTGDEVSADRGLKVINTLVTLIRAGHIDVEELSRGVFQLELEPALVAECSQVMNEI